MWKVIEKTLNPNRDKSQNSITRISLNAKSNTDDPQIAAYVNEFLCSVAKNLAENYQNHKGNSVKN